LRLPRDSLVSAILIPAALVSAGVDNGHFTINQNEDIVAQIKEHVYKWIPNYDDINDSDMSYGPANSTISSMELAVGDCRPRTSLGAAIALANGLDFRIVGSYNLAPRIQIPSTQYAEMWAEHTQTPVTNAENDDHPRFRTFRHWWLEVKIGIEWLPVDNMQENPVTFGWFQKGVKNKIICSIISLDDLIPANNGSESVTRTSYLPSNSLFQIPEGAYLNN